MSKYFYPDQTIAVLLTAFFGYIGVHHAYFRRYGRFLLSLLFFWTFIPAIIAFFELIVYCMTSNFSETYKKLIK